MTGPKQSDEHSEASYADDAAVSAYLAAHPDFFSRHPDLIATLVLPGRTSGDNIADFQTFALHDLKRRLADMDVMQDDLIQMVRSNLSSQAQVHAAVLAAMRADGLDHLIHIITEDWVDVLDVDAVSLCLEAGTQQFRASGTGILLLPSGRVDETFNQGESIRLESEVAGDDTLFGPAAPLVRSQALVRLEMKPPLPRGLVAFGARHGDAFAPGQGTELLSFLGRALELCLVRWLTARPQ